jgi:hypothetical protein
MTGFLTLDRLRAHAAPFDWHDPPRRDDPPPRPVLTAQWYVAADGQLTCRWLADDPAPDRPPL